MRHWIWALLLTTALLVAACGGAAPAPVAPATEAMSEAATEVATEEATAEAAMTEEAMAEEAMTEEAMAEGGSIVLPEVNPLEVSGDIITAGSSTVFPLAERMAERFIDEGYAGNITIDSIGSGAGFERFCTAGETDISNASRPIKDSEVENCRAIGREPIEFRVGTDALAVVVNPENDWIGETGVTLEELAKLFASDVTNWSDVNPAWPAEPIKRFSPGTDSGTFDFFVEAVMDPAYGDGGEEALLGAENLQLSEDDNVLVAGVEGDLYGIGYFGYAYYEENKGSLQILAINGVAASPETVDAGEYPLARPLFMYSDATVMQSKPQVASFLNFVLSNVDEEIRSVGYFPASAEALNSAKQAWLDAVGAEAAAMAGEAMMAAVELPEVNPLEVSGDIITAGSSTVFPLAERMAERFIDEGYAGNITIDSIGSGAGFERFCTAGETDISNASRPIKDSEVENCRAIGREPIEFRVGTDALAVVVNPENDWIGETGVTLEELAKLFASDVTNWSDVNPAWPAEPIKRFSPGTDSGTFDFFVEAVMDPAYGDGGEEALLGAENLQLSEDDNVLVAGVEGDLYGIGYFGYAYYEENKGSLQILAINGVAASPETVDAGEYPLARPLFMYSDATVMQSKPQVASFLNFVLSNVDEEIRSVGYFPASAEALNNAKQAWLDAVGQ
ncbi:MAG: PstS family phosphate ABC transporter substrate-binding protein [Caldilineaceae bacterium]|nr:PstS family phosphate ABC transporter substrate-binding protein [Caldilineaceae bacterium]